MTGPGRPRIGARVEFTIPDDLLAYVDAEARVEGITRAAMLRKLLEYGVEVDREHLTHWRHAANGVA